MRITNVTNTIAFNTVMARFAPDHGKRGYRVEANGDVTIMVIDNCDHCNKECEGANSIILPKPRKFVMEKLERMVRTGVIVKTDVTDETGCTEDGDCVCSDCWSKANEDKMDDILLTVGAR